MSDKEDIIRNDSDEQAVNRSEHDDQVDNKKESLLYHLNELRKLLIRVAAALIIGIVLCFTFAVNPLMKFIEAPIVERGIQIITTGVSEGFAIKFKVSIVAGIILVSPFLFYSLWVYIKPALYDNEIRAFRLLFLCALFLFLTGVVFCYTCVYNLAITFFVESGENIATPLFKLDEYVSFLLGFILPFGVAFELPVALYMAAKMGLTNYAKLAKARKYVFFGIFVLAAVLTPPDVVSQIMLGVPMYALYELGIQVARRTKPRNAEEAEG